jgi:hypothetical protein
MIAFGLHTATMIGKTKNTGAEILKQTIFTPGRPLGVSQRPFWLHSPAAIAVTAAISGKGGKILGAKRDNVRMEWKPG